MTLHKSILLHISVCLLITALLPYGWLLAIIIGIIKELYDRYIKKTTFDWLDIAGDLLGVIFGLIYKYFL